MVTRITRAAKMAMRKKKKEKSRGLSENCMARLVDDAQPLETGVISPRTATE
jgi:hypothetical protein